MSKKKLTLDKDRLVRLQDSQLDAASGGADGNGSTTVTVTIGSEAFADAAADGSCCNKSCRNEAA